jgi:peroxiredoxin
MVRTPSTMLPLGTPAPDFSLPNIDGTTVSLGDFKDAAALVVVFMCNHCPFVKHVAPELARFARDYAARNVAVVGISSNDVSGYPDDAPDKMVAEAKARGYAFPYLYDESQAVAQAYRAACTPDFYLFDKSRRLFYRGQFDNSRPESGIPVTGADLRSAVEAALTGDSPPAEQRPSLGCNIKWKKGNEPDYFG